MPSTQSEWAKEHGVENKNLLTKWKKWVESGKLKPEEGAFAGLGAQGVKIDKALVLACEVGKVEALRTYYQEMARRGKENGGVKFEFSHADRVKIATEVIAGLREQYQTTGGVCPVCHFTQMVCAEPRLYSEPEYKGDSSVATLAVPA